MYATDTGLAPISVSVRTFFGDREGMVEQSRQPLADGIRLFCFPERVLQLSEDLRLAEDHRVQAAGDAEKMLYRVVAVQREQGAGGVLIERLVRLEPAAQRRSAVCRRFSVDLSAVAG